jgi:hypothetical protein
MTQISLDSAAARLLAAAAHARVNPAREHQPSSEHTAHDVLTVVDRDLLIAFADDHRVRWTSATGDDVVVVVVNDGALLGGGRRCQHHLIGLTLGSKLRVRPILPHTHTGH